jgi:hypothetical protein
MAKRIPYDGDYRTEDIGPVSLEYISNLFDGDVIRCKLDTGAVVLWSYDPEWRHYNRRASTLVSLADDGTDKDGNLRRVYGDALWLSRLEWFALNEVERGQ